MLARFEHLGVFTDDFRQRVARCLDEFRIDVFDASINVRDHDNVFRLGDSRRELAPLLILFDTIRDVGGIAVNQVLVLDLVQGPKP